MDIRGVAVAEGDSLVLSIRRSGLWVWKNILTVFSGLISELLLGRYELPAARYPQSFLALHESGLLSELKAVMLSFGGKHRSRQFNNHILPHALELSEAIGLRMAYEEAKDASVDSVLLDLFEIGAVRRDLSWYVENKVVSRQEAIEREENILSALIPGLDRYLAQTGAKPYVFAAIVSDSAWVEFFASLPVLHGNALMDPLNPHVHDTIRARL